jgi:homoserine dehydrogenase|tara:strand:- start:1203 stop:1391 length:189 start_codon:yes stop_codon:yes gene_type:complete
MEKFMQDIEAFIASTGMGASTFGRRFIGDPGFVFSLRRGRECRESTQRRVRAGMAIYLEARQ